MEAVCSSKTFVPTYKSTRRYNPGDQHRHRHSRENFRSHIINETVYLYHWLAFLFRCKHLKKQYGQSHIKPSEHRQWIFILKCRILFTTAPSVIHVCEVVFFSTLEKPRRKHAVTAMKHPTTWYTQLFHHVKLLERPIAAAGTFFM
jgi:hypothetical protein